MNRGRVSSCAILIVVCASPVQAEDRDLAGMSSDRLGRARQVLQEAVASKTVGSAVGLISRSGRIVFEEAVGEAAPNVPMPVDAIVRLASITKPVTAAAILALNEQGRLALTDAVESYLPEFHDVKVAAGDGLEPPMRPITLHDLLTHQAGLMPDNTAELNAVWEKAETTAGFSRLLAALPLRFQPGTRWEYGPGYEVLTAVVEKITGQSYAAFLESSLLAPLKMKDTTFHVSGAALQRLVTQYRRDPAGELAVFRALGQEERPTTFYSGGGGLRSTVQDFHRFALCLLRGGALEGVRVLSPKSVELMTADHAGSRYPREHYGYGLGVEVRTAAGGDSLGSVGAFSWNGGTGTLFVVDPPEQLVVIIFAPTTPGTPGVAALRRAFVNAAYQAIVASAPPAALAD